MTLSELRQNTQSQQLAPVNMTLDTVAGFENMQRAARLFACSSIVPASYQGEKGMPNCFIAIDMALRMGANPLLVMQNLYIVHGNPAWSAQFLIATFNKCGKFSAIRYEFVGEAGKDSWGCRAVATELATKEKLVGPLVTIGLAKKEGWFNKSGSKWLSMPEMMLRYRAAAWFVRVYAPEIAMGLKTAEEEEDRVITVEASRDGVYEMTLDNVANPPVASETAQDAKPEKKQRRKARPVESEPATNQAVNTQSVETAEPMEQEGQNAETAPNQSVEYDNSAEQIEEPLQANKTEGSPPRYECPRDWPDGKRMVTPAQCKVCKYQTGCPDYWPEPDAETVSEAPPSGKVDF